MGCEDHGLFIRHGVLESRTCGDDRAGAMLQLESQDLLATGDARRCPRHILGCIEMVSQNAGCPSAWLTTLDKACSQEPGCEIWAIPR